MFNKLLKPSQINYIVDPYGIYNTNFFKNKPFSYSQMRIVKAVKTKYIKPNSIILGTSRAEVAINPNHEYFIKPAYNLAVSGSTLYESKLFLKNAIKAINNKQEETIQKANKIIGDVQNFEKEVSKKFHHSFKS